MCILCICVRVLWAPRHVQDRGASGFPHADQLLAATYKACMFWINVPHTHMPAILPGSWHGFEEKIGIFLVHVNVCVRVCVGCVVVFCREITSHCSCAEPTRDSTYSHTDTRYVPCLEHTHTHTALFSIRSWLERKASKQLVKKKVHSSSRKSFAYFFFFCRSDSPSDERTLLCLLIFIADE